VPVSEARVYTFDLNLFRPFWEMFRELHECDRWFWREQLYIARSRVGNPTNFYIPAPEGKTKTSVTFRADGNIPISLRLCFPINCATKHCLHSRCCCLLARVLSRKYWTLSYVTSRIFHSGHIYIIYSVPLFLLHNHNIAIRFLHWSSQATTGTPASTYLLHGAESFLRS
jgi:hypothetical protein